MSDLPKSWFVPYLADLLSALPDGKYIHQGWSPRCEAEPSQSVEDWAVLKTTSIQDGAFLPQHNKKLPSNLTPKPNLEVRQGDILITCAGPRIRCGVTCLVRWTRPKLIISGKMYRFQVFKGLVDPAFVEAALRTKEAQIAIDDMKTGMSESGMNLTHMRFAKLTIPLAPYSEQRRIVAKMDNLADKSKRARDHLNHIPRLVEKYKHAILSRAFNGTWTEHWRDNTGGLMSYGHSLEAIDSRANTLADLPVGWGWHAFRDVVNVSGGLTKNSKRNELLSKRPYLRVANVYANELRLDEVSEIGCTEAEFAKTRLCKGDLLIVEGNGSLEQIGRVAIWADQVADCSHQNHIIRARTKGSLFPAYGLYWLMSPEGRSAIETVATSSSGLHTLSISKVGGLPIPVCDNSEQREIVRRIESAFDWIDHVASEAISARKLVDHLDQAILSKAFRGELVPQDPNDEPASVLLERIHAERASAPAAKRGRRKQA